jgi:hypothetical protein
MKASFLFTVFLSLSIDIPKGSRPSQMVCHGKSQARDLTSAIFRAKDLVEQKNGRKNS